MQRGVPFRRRALTSVACTLATVSLFFGSETAHAQSAGGSPSPAPRPVHIFGGDKGSPSPSPRPVHIFGGDKGSPSPSPRPVHIFGGDHAQPPYQYLDAKGQPQGFNVDLIRAIARVSGRQIVVQLQKGDVLDLLETGDVDLAALSYTEERTERYGFLDEVWTVRLSAFFMPGRKSPPDSISKLGGEIIAVRTPSLSRDTLASLPEAQRPTLVAADDHKGAVALLFAGRVTAAAGNDIGLRAEFARLGYTDVPEVLLKANAYRLATTRGREKEFAWVSAALKQLRDTGEFSRIVEKHLANPRSEGPFRDFAHRAAIIIAALAAVFVIVLLWNRSLRTQVGARTARLAEAAAEKDVLVRSLAEREQRMRVLVEQMPAILWSTDANLLVTSASGLGIKTLGMASTQLVGVPAEQIVDEYRLRESGVMERLRLGLTGQASDLELKISGRDAEVHIEPLRDTAGVVYGLVGIVLDVTDRRSTARALRDSEERYRAFVERSTEGIWRWEFRSPWPKDATLDEQMRHLAQEGYVAECNDAMARLYGLASASELVGLRFYQIRALRTPVTSTENTRAFVAGGFQPARWETNWIDRNGVSRWSSNGVMGIVEDGRLIRVWATQQDITQQKNAEEGLRHALSLVRATLESTDDGILVVNKDGAIVDVNRRFANLWEIPPSTLVPGATYAASVRELIVEQVEDPADFAPRVERILAEPESESYDVLRLKDGRFFERYSRPQRLGETTVGRVWSFRDITERERSLAEIREANRLLEIKNAELERFTYTVSHDLKSPLITIRGYLGHLEASAESGNLERFREDASRISRATAKMDALLRDLLELSRIGRVLSPATDVPMANVAQDAADLLRGPLRERGVRLVISPDLPSVRGDRQRLLEVVQNLVENATKFMGDQKDPLITVGVRQDGSERVFYVSDNGIGIDARHREKVFDLFEKLTPRGEGTGVGLALVKRIVEAHGGRVWVESPGVGLGSTFCFTLRGEDERL
jgi:PAS domain S-box-containing protein